jgi:archaellum component FlaC
MTNEDFQNRVLSNLNSISNSLEAANTRLSGIETRLEKIEDRLRKIELFVPTANADFHPKKKVTA